VHGLALRAARHRVHGLRPQGVRVRVRARVRVRLRVSVRARARARAGARARAMLAIAYMLYGLQVVLFQRARDARPG
jgi:hypothetical protein